MLANPGACGEKAVTALLTPWSGGAAKTATATFTIDADGKGGACTAAAFAPALQVASDSTAAGRPGGQGHARDLAAGRLAGPLAGHDRAAARARRLAQGRAGLR